MNKEQAKRNAFLPLIGMIIMYGLLFYYGVFFKGPYSYADDFLMLVAIVLVFAVAIYTMVVMIKYIIYVIKIPDMTKGKKILWMFLLYSFNVFVFPIFWYVQIRDKEENSELLEEEEAQRNYKHSQKAVKGMSNKQAVVAAFLPLLLWIVLYIVLSWVMGNSTANKPAEELMSNLLLILVFILVPIYTFVTSINFTIDMVGREHISGGKKIIWGICFFVFSIFTFPIYWMIYADKSGLVLTKDEKEYRREVTKRNREFDKKRNAEIRENKARGKEKEKAERVEAAIEHKRAAVSFFRRKPPVFLANVPLFMVLTCITLYEAQICFVIELSDFGFDLMENLLKWAVVLLIICFIVVLAVYELHICFNEQFSMGKKIGWFVLTFILNVLAFPIYQDVYIHDKSKNDSKYMIKEFIWSIVPGLEMVLFGLILLFLLWMPIYPLIDLLFWLLLYFIPLAYAFNVFKYIVQVCENEQLTSGKKALWSIGFILLGIIACPVYWSRYIRIKNENE